MRVAHLGNHTGEAYHAAVTAQARPGGDEEQAPMEAELASRAAASMIAGTSDRPARGSRPQLSLPVVPIGH